MAGISVESLKERGIVGDLCFHLLDAAGNAQEKRLSAGLSAVSLKTLQHLVVLASNPLKAGPIYSVIRGGDSARGYANVLIIASQVAERLLTLAESAQHDAALRLF